MAESDKNEFPENEVDNLIADFGKKPSEQERDALKEMLLEQKGQFNAVREALDQAQEQDKDHDQERGR